MEVGRLLAERYEILRPLAEGAMSTVWVALDRTNSIEVAVKTISLDAAGWRAEIRDRFMKEARLLARGKHEHLVGVRDVGETEDGFLYLVLDLLEGETLAERLARETRLSWQEAVTLTLGITRGVAALHRAGIVHRDLKPANIVLHQKASDVVPTIIDLGIGKASGVVGDPQLCATLTATGQVLGTPQYMSYEQALGQTDIDARTDVWALGVMLYEMVTGARPFEGPNTNAVLAAIRRRDIRPIREVAADVPNAVTQVVDVCLRTNRSERYVDAEALATRLEDAARAPDVVTPDVVRNEPPATKPHPPRRRMFVMAMVPGFILFAAAAIVLARTPSPHTPVNSEIAVDVKGSSSVVIAEPSVNPRPTTSVSAAATEPPSAVTAMTSTAPKPTSSARNRPPVSHVDEAGF